MVLEEQKVLLFLKKEDLVNLMNMDYVPAFGVTFQELGTPMDDMKLCEAGKDCLFLSGPGQTF